MRGRKEREKERGKEREKEGGREGGREERIFTKHLTVSQA
jgi:hypothetical protein